jgi:hypothetical protein
MHRLSGGRPGNAWTIPPRPDRSILGGMPAIWDERSDRDDPALRRCPFRDCEYVHQGETLVALRGQEDGLAVEISISGAGIIGPAMAGIPRGSLREGCRNRTALAFSCERGCEYAAVYTRHKGTTIADCVPWGCEDSRFLYLLPGEQQWARLLNAPAAWLTRQLGGGSPVVFALCVLREPVHDAAGRLAGLRDYVDYVDHLRVRIPAIRVIAQRLPGIFAPLRAAAATGKPAYDHDFPISRNSYEVIAVHDTVPAPSASTLSWKRYLQALEVAGIDLGHIAAEYTIEDADHAVVREKGYRRGWGWISDPDPLFPREGAI